MVPQDLRYTETHEWVKREGNIVKVGITDFAQEQLSDVVYVGLPEIGKKVAKGEECTVIESCKIAAELYAPVSGTIAAVNTDLADHPESVNLGPYDKGWMVMIEMADEQEYESLMDPSSYETYAESSRH